MGNIEMFDLSPLESIPIKGVVLNLLEIHPINIPHLAICI